MRSQLSSSGPHAISSVQICLRQPPSQVSAIPSVTARVVRHKSDVQMFAGIYRLLTMLRHASRMLPVGANLFTHPDRTDQRVDARHLSLDHRDLVMPFASDPELTARREIKLLRIEVEQLRAVERMLRAELEVLRADRDEDRKTKELLFAYVEEVEQLLQSRDYLEREAKRSSGLRSHSWPLVAKRALRVGNR
jgi:hypothetical protein